MARYPFYHGCFHIFEFFFCCGFCCCCLFWEHFVCFGWDRISLCSPSWPGDSKNPPDSASWVLGFEAWVTMPSGHLILIVFSQEFVFYRWKKIVINVQVIQTINWCWNFFFWPNLTLFPLEDSFCFRLRLASGHGTTCLQSTDKYIKESDYHIKWIIMP